MEGIGILVSPLLVGLMLTLILRAIDPRGARWAALGGTGLAACAALLVGFLVPNTYSSGEPVFTDRVGAELLVVFIYVSWLIGVAVSAGLFALFTTAHRGPGSRSVDE